MAGCEITSKSGDGVGIGGSFGLGDHQCGAGICDAGDPDIKKAALNWRLWVLLRT